MMPIISHAFGQQVGDKIKNYSAEENRAHPNKSD
jgi:hypothetical protein